MPRKVFYHNAQAVSCFLSIVCVHSIRGFPSIFGQSLLWSISMVHDTINLLMHSTKSSQCNWLNIKEVSCSWPLFCMQRYQCIMSTCSGKKQFYYKFRTLPPLENISGLVLDAGSVHILSACTRRLWYHMAPNVCKNLISVKVNFMKINLVANSILVYKIYSKLFTTWLYTVYAGIFAVWNFHWTASKQDFRNYIFFPRGSQVPSFHFFVG